MKLRPARFWDLLKKTAKGWMDDNPFQQGALVGYYAIFSLPALLVLIVNIIGFFFQRQMISHEISRQVSEIMGNQTAKQVEDILNNAGKVKAGLLPGLIAIVVLITGATGVFVQFQSALNGIWEVRQKPNIGILAMLKNRLFSFGLILAIGFLLLVSLVISSLLASVSHWMEQRMPHALIYLVYGIDFLVSFAVIVMLFALMFKYLPDVKVPWRGIWPGAILTSLLFLFGKYGLSLYFGKAAPASVYGTSSSIVLIILWVTYSSMIVFFGAEFTRQYMISNGVKIVLDDNAELIDNCK